MVANEPLEKAKAYFFLKQVPSRGTPWLYIPSKGCSVKLQVKTPSEYTYLLFLGRAELMPSEKISLLLQWGWNLGPLGL